MNDKLMINAALLRKESEFRTKSCVVEKAIAVSHADFDDLKRHPLQDNKLIAENADLMYCDSDDNYHCLLVYDKEQCDGLLIESEGSAYARYAQYIPRAKELVERHQNPEISLTDGEKKLCDSGELHNIYEQQTDLHNLLKKEFTQLMKQLAENISRNKNFDSELINLVSKLHGQLTESKGKKVYGYLKSDVKKTVDEIFARLASNESIKKMYNLWCEMEQQKHDVYSSAKVQFPNLVDNKKFKSVKNMIVQTVMQMEFPTVDIEIEIKEIYQPCFILFSAPVRQIRVI